MSRASALLAVITPHPTSTSDLYEQIGYATLVRLGLIPYDAFRAELAALAATGAIESATAPDGSTLWSLPAENGPPGGPIIG